MEWSCKEFNCVECGDPLKTDIESKYPILIGCGHNVCQQCAENLLKQGPFMYCKCCEKKDVKMARKNRVSGKWEFYGKNYTLMDAKENEKEIWMNRDLCPTDCTICFRSMTSWGEKIPKILVCGHTFCLSCLREYKKCSNNERCPLCRSETFTRTADSCITNFVLKAFIGRKEKWPSKCRKHEDQFVLFVCKSPSCKSEILCLQCKNEEKHIGHRLAHVINEARYLRDMIMEIGKAADELKDRYRKDEQIFLESAKTYEKGHRDYVHLILSMNNYLEDLKETDPEYDYETEYDYATERVAELCASRIKSLTESSQQRKQLGDEIVVRRQEMANWAYYSNSRLVTFRDKINPIIISYIPPPADFEKERLERYFVYRTIGERLDIARFRDTSVYIANEEAEHVWKRFVGWFCTVGERLGYEPNINEKRITFEYNKSHYWLSIYRQEHPDQQSNACQFTGVFGAITSVFSLENGVSVNDVYFPNIGEGFLEVMWKLSQ